MPHDPVTGDLLRTAMRQVPSPVTVVTAAPRGARAGNGAARGMTVGSFTSVSLEPPLISVSVHRDAQMHSLLPEAPRFAVHVLRREQAHLAVHFAIPDRTGAEQFAAVPHRTDAHGTPVLDGALAVLHCRVHDAVAAGDHTIFVGEVVGVEQEGGEGEPAVYYRSSYRQVGEAVPPEALAPAEEAQPGEPAPSAEAEPAVNRASSEAP